jgi:hypothetical protein
MRVRMIAVLGLALVGALPSSTAQAAATVTVDTVEDSYDGTCADDCSIRDAIVSVDSGGIVRIAPGYYVRWTSSTLAERSNARSPNPEASMNAPSEPMPAIVSGRSTSRSPIVDPAGPRQ